MAPNQCLNKKKRNFEFVEFLISKFLWDGLLSSRLEIYRYLSNKPGGRGGALNFSSQCLLINARYEKPKGIQRYYQYSFLQHQVFPHQITSILRNLGQTSKREFFQEQELKFGMNHQHHSERAPKKNASKRNFNLFLVDILIKHDDHLDIPQITSAENA